MGGSAPPDPLGSTLSGVACEMKTLVGKKTTSWPVGRSISLLTKLTDPCELTLRTENRSTSSRRRHIEVVAQDLRCYSAESLSTDYIIGIIVVILLLLRLAAEGRAVSQQEAQSQLKRGQAALRPSCHELTYTL